MGCSQSQPIEPSRTVRKSLPQEKVQPVVEPAENEEDKGTYISEEEAIDYVRDELGTTEARARRMIAQVQHDNDPRISSTELQALWGQIKQKKAEVKAEFIAMDTDNNGYVTPDEAVAVMSRRFPGFPEESVRAMAKRFDTDDNGKMQYDEFVYFYGNMIAKRETLEDEFTQMAKSNNGNLRSRELIEVISRHCVLEEYMARSLVEDFDINSDGVISQKEFANMMSSMFD